MSQLGVQTRSKCEGFLELLWQRGKLSSSWLGAAACGLPATHSKNAGQKTRTHHWISSRSESVIDADAQQVRFNAVVRTREHKRTIIQIDVKVFRSCRPVRHQRDLDTGTGRPAGAGPRFRYASGVLCRQGSIGETHRSVEQKVARGDSGARAQRAEPGIGKFLTGEPMVRVR